MGVTGAFLGTPLQGVWTKASTVIAQQLVTKAEVQRARRLLHQPGIEPPKAKSASRFRPAAPRSSGAPQLVAAHVALRDDGKPNIQMDYMFMGQSCTALVMIDSWTRYGRVIPLPSKAATKKLAEEVVRFSVELSYGKEDEVTFAMDTEKATTSLLEMVVEVRVRMGLKAAKQFGKPYDKGRTAKVERYIQTVRSQAMTLIASVEDAIGRILPMEHVLRAWALQHSAWLLNRFHWHSSIAASPFATVHGRPYGGKIIPFGEYCYGLKKPTVKGTRSALWTGGIWVGKTSQQDMRLLMVGDGTIICKSVRRSREPWKSNMVLELSGSPWTAKPRKVTKLVESMMPPLPQILEEAGGVEDPETDDSPSSMEEQSGEIAQKLEFSRGAVQMQGWSPEASKEREVKEKRAARRSSNRMMLCSLSCWRLATVQKRAQPRSSGQCEWECIHRCLQV